MDRVNERERAFRGGDSGVKYLARGPKIDWGVILLKPGEEMKEHGHAQVEETFYVVEGAPIMVVDGADIQAETGDVFRLDPFERHAIRNDGDVSAKLVFVKTPYLPDDKI